MRSITSALPISSRTRNLLKSASSSASPLFDFTGADAERALERARCFCEYFPNRDSGTPGAFAAAKYIANYCTGGIDRYTAIRATRAAGISDFQAGRTQQWLKYQVSARIDSFIDDTPNGPLEFHNVLAVLPAKNPAVPWIVLISHYDTKSGIPNFVGANDGASSTALLITLYKLLTDCHKLPFNFLFAFLDGEECQISYSANDGLHGSRRLARQLKDEGRDVRAVIVLDMIGDADLHIAIPANCTPDLRARALAAATKAGTRDYFSLSKGAIIDDHVPFLELGFPVLNFIDFDYGPNNSYWHTSEDTPDKLSANSFLVVGRTVLQLIADL